MKPDLEKVCRAIRFSENAEGVMMIILHAGNRMEFVSALPKGTDGPAIEEILKKVAKIIEDGDGIPMGNHLKNVNLET